MNELRALSRRRKLVYFTLVYCVLGLVLLGVCELVVRLAFPPFAMRYNVWPPGTTLSRSADPDSMAGVEGFPDFRINRLGVRGRLPDANDEIRILAIGGSTTACEVLGYEESWRPRRGDIIIEDSTGTEFIAVGVREAGGTFRPDEWHVNAKERADSQGV